MKILSSLFTIAIFLTAFNAGSQEVNINDKLEKLWETSDGLKTTESVLYDPIGKVIYVSNINENPWEKDGNGYISRLKPNGEILDAQWVKGLSAPKGMGLVDGKLFVTNIDEVVEIDVKTATITKRYTHPQAFNFNDIAVGADGKVYVSDSKGNCIFEVFNGKINILIESKDGPTNGLFYERGRLLCGQNDRVALIDLNTKIVSTFIDHTGSIDGLEGIGDSSYLISDWSGHIHLIKQGVPKVLLLDTTPAKINAADIEYNPVDKILYVPTFFKNSVVAYKLQ